MQQGPAGASRHGSHEIIAALLIYLVAFITGAIVMSFEMLGSRYLNPYFGSGIYTWAALISTVLTALTAGYFLGGWLADRKPAAPVLGVVVMIGSVYLLLLPSFAGTLLELTLAAVDDIETGSLLAALAIMFFPVTLLGMYSPFAIRLLLRSAHRSGVVSGTVYGISTAGSIVGTLGTTFFLLPAIGSRAITLTLGAAGLLAGLVLVALPYLGRRTSAVAIATGALLFGLAAPAPAAHADEFVNEQVRAALLKQTDGQVDHIETRYNDIYITKRRNELTMSFQLKGWDYTESVINLRELDDLPVRYTREMTVAVVYPPAPRKILMIGLGGGTITTYLGRAMPDATINVVELDPGVIDAAKKYFGLRDSARIHYLSGDGRVMLRRSKEQYDLILVDAFRGGYVPFHLLTREFYALLKERLAPGGAAVFNVHSGTKLYLSTLRTLSAVFASVHIYPSGEGETITVATPEPAPSADTLASRAAALQQRYNFRFPMPALLARRAALPAIDKADVLTDDFAPADVYDAIGERVRKKN
ncbi:MAG TPA: fused MFS/spermidine synthase [Xanthobacteraceae bacterium]|nr:fused MFS/spermidine synthase [Xanthobacteraceae bacterium]